MYQFAPPGTAVPDRRAPRAPWEPSRPPRARRPAPPARQDNLPQLRDPRHVVVRGETTWSTLADLGVRGTCAIPSRSKFLHFLQLSCSLVHLLGVSATGKSWIRHWFISHLSRPLLLLHFEFCKKIQQIIWRIILYLEFRKWYLKN